MNKTPWTDHEAYLLNQIQKDRNIHPYTCDRKSPKCETKTSNKDGILIATTNGWICPCGEYKQTWH